MDTAIEKFRKRRITRLARRMDAKHYDAPDNDSETPNVGNNHAGKNRKRNKENHGNTHLPYGIAKSLGMDTTGMEPREVWDMLSGKYGIKPNESYKKLEKGEKVEPNKETSKPKAKVTTIKVGGGNSGKKEKEYRSLCIKHTSFTGSKPGWELRGVTEDERGRSIDGTVKQFYTQEDLLYYLKDKGVDEFSMGTKTVNPQEMELPDYIGGTEERKFKSITIKKSDNGFDIYGEYLDGGKHKMETVPSVKVAKDTIEKKYGVPRDKITMSKKTIAADRERNSWARTKDGSHFTDGKRTVKDISISSERAGDEYKFKLSGTDNNGEAYEKKFDTLKDTIDFLKSNEVTAATLGDSQINPSTYEIPKVVFKQPFTKKEYTSLSLETGKYGSLNLVGIGVDGTRSIITSREPYMQMQDFENTLTRYGLSLDDSRINVSDSAKKYIKEHRG